MIFLGILKYNRLFWLFKQCTIYFSRNSTFVRFIDRTVDQFSAHDLAVGDSIRDWTWIFPPISRSTSTFMMRSITSIKYTHTHNDKHLINQNISSPLNLVVESNQKWKLNQTKYQSLWTKKKNISNWNLKRTIIMIKSSQFVWHETTCI